MAGNIGQRQFAQYRNAVMHRLAMQGMVRKAQFVKWLCGENIIHHLGFLQAQNIGREFADEILHQIDAEADAVNIP
jgi:hypothetical protein